MQTIIITSTDEMWARAQQAGFYSQSTINSKIEDVGFIHATKPDQTIAMLNRHFSERDDILLLVVDLARVKPEVKFEAPLSGNPGKYPHIYGVLNIDAVYKTVSPSKDQSGNFIESDFLAELTG